MVYFCRIIGSCVVIGTCTLEEASLASEIEQDITFTLSKTNTPEQDIPKDLSDEQTDERDSESQSSSESIDVKFTIGFVDPYDSLGRSISANLLPWLPNVPSPMNIKNQFMEGSKYYGTALKDSLYYAFVIKIDNLSFDF